MADWQELLAAAAAPQGLSAPQMAQALEELFAGRCPVEQGAEFLVRLRQRGETAVELSTLVEALFARARPLELGELAVCDIVGTGGSGRARFNVSTTASVVVAACGVPVAKHGNRGSRRPNGSFDLLAALEVPLELPAGAHRELLAACNLCFVFARQFHPAMAAVAPLRRLAGERVSGTIFNLAGPLANPARPRAQLLGTASERHLQLIAETLWRRRQHGSLVVWSPPDLDEVTLAGPCEARLIAPGGPQARRLAPPAPPLPDSALAGGDAAENAALFQRILAGEPLPLAEMVAVNAGIALALWRGLPPEDAGCRAEAREALRSGRAGELFARYRALAQQLVQQA
ncbi:MAG: anthranilate phosphoribosyltransferase [Planctomycetota bacterium]|nr:anthranilate phosphoribosyltransferase [Planctomycetota bacterium]